MTRRAWAVFIAAAVLMPLSACRPPLRAVRIGYTLDLAHSPAIVAFAQRRYARLNGKSVRSSVFSASPIAVESLAAGDLDIAFVGPVPALNVIMRTNNRYAVIAGAAYGGGSLVVAKDSKASKLEDLKDAKVATTYVGDTTDVAARATFGELGFVSVGQGGGSAIVPVPSHDLMKAFARGEVSAAWTVEPWATQLVKESGARVLLADADMWTPVNASTRPFQTVVVVARRALIDHYPKVLDEFLRIHADVVKWIEQNPAEAQAQVAAPLAKSAGRPFAPGVIAEAWKNVRFTTEISVESLERAADAAYRLGFLGSSLPEMENVIDPRPLERVKKGIKK